VKTSSNNQEWRQKANGRNEKKGEKKVHNSSNMLGMDGSRQEVYMAALWLQAGSVPGGGWQWQKTR
jgi:hypothetical protein